MAISKGVVLYTSTEMYLPSRSRTKMYSLYVMLKAIHSQESRTS